MLKNSLAAKPNKLKSSNKPSETLSRHKTMEKYQALFDSNMIGIATTDFNDTIFEANEAFLSIIGYSQKDLQKGGLRWSTISPVKFNETDQVKMEELFRNITITPFEKEYRHKKGHLVPVLVGAEATDETFTAGVSFAVDISQLKALQQKKDDFIGMVSHELKTPLAVMKLYVNLLQNSIQNGLKKVELNEYVNHIDNEIDKINLLITDLFNMAKFEADTSSMPITAVDLRNCVREAVDGISLINRNRHILFEDRTTIYANANEQRLSQVIINLINNALRYSNEESPVRVHLYKRHNKACIAVEDKGLGIKPENLDKIFERYYRINRADDYAQEGAGIGLYICREIIKNHGGHIHVESIVGRGSIFTIELPLVKNSL